jgi:hypothetical protein
LRPSRPSRKTSSPIFRENKRLLSIRASIRTTFKLLTLFFSFPSFYERQTPFPTPPPRSKPLGDLDAKPQRPKAITIDKFTMANSQFRTYPSSNPSLACLREFALVRLPPHSKGFALCQDCGPSCGFPSNRRASNNSPCAPSNRAAFTKPFSGPPELPLPPR